MQARIFNIQKYSIFDGPGIRTLVFFQGCPLRCLWCANPEGKKAAPRIMWSEAMCAHCGKCAHVCPNGAHGMAEGRHVFDPAKCDACGRCAAACPCRAIELSGGMMSIEEIMAEVMKDIVFYQTSGGGLTLGGGEPLAQPDAAAELLKAAKAKGLHTAVETCGFAPAESLAKVAPYVDLFLYDIKHMESDTHKGLTGVGNGPILENLAWLVENGYPVRARMPLINGCNADLAEMRARAAFLGQWKGRPNFKGVDLLPYHKLGLHKYAKLGEEYTLGKEASVPEGFLEEAAAIFGEAGVETAIVRH